MASMRARASRAWAAAFVGAALLLAPAAASARRPAVATDAFYVGTRLAPGAALTGAWDLDVYLTRNRLLSVGPSVSLSVLADSEPAGQAIDLFVGVDVVRIKIGVNEPGGAFRPFFLLGGGFYYAQFPEERTQVRVAGADGMPVTGEVVLPEDDEFGGLVTFGFGADLFIDGPWALTLVSQNRARASTQDRVPELSTELLVGVRFGL